MSDFRGRARSVRIALAQLDGAPGDVEANLSRTRQIVAEARAAGANLVVFPELFLTGYLPIPGRGNLAIAADDVRLTMLANGGPEGPGAIIGFQEAARLGLLHNSAVYLQAGKACHVHRKVSLVSCHLFQEGRRFSTGSAIRALDTPWGRMGILIRNHAWQAGVRPGRRPRRRPDSGHPGQQHRQLRLRAAGAPGRGKAITRFHATLLECYVVFVNRVGTEGKGVFWGGSHVLDLAAAGSPRLPCTPGSS